MITAFDKPTLQALRRDLDAALLAVAEKHGIKITTGTIRFDLATFSATIKAEIPAAKADEDMRWANTFASGMGVDISEPSKHPMRTGAKMTGYDTAKRAKPWKFEWRGKNYVTDDAGIRLMFPAAKDERPVPVEVDNLLTPQRRAK